MLKTRAEVMQSRVECERCRREGNSAIECANDRREKKKKTEDLKMRREMNEKDKTYQLKRTQEAFNAFIRERDSQSKGCISR